MQQPAFWAQKKLVQLVLAWQQEQPLVLVEAG
jgi:hypothetical protein